MLSFFVFYLIILMVNNISAGDYKQAFMYLNATIQDYEHDCNFEATRETLNFLSLELSDLESDTLALSLIKNDCALRKTKLDRLRTFLAEKTGFLQAPGSVRFVNYQDPLLDLICSTKDDHDPKDYRFHSRGLADDKTWYNDVHLGKMLRIAAPPAQVYFRKYSCFSLKHSCTHYFYVITRPYPRIKRQMKLLAVENDVFDVECEINPCTTVKNPRLEDKCSSRNSNLDPQGPLSMEWRLPSRIVKEINETGGYKTKYTCMHDGDDPVESGSQIYIPIISPSGSATDVTAGLIKGTTITASKVTYNVGNTSQPISSILQLKPALEEHTGLYECVVTDINGVPSTPERNTLTEHKTRFAGRGSLSVRPWFMFLIPLIVVVLVCIGMFIIWGKYRTHDRLEFDDGTVQTIKHEEVGPETFQSAAPSAVPSGAVSVTVTVKEPDDTTLISSASLRTSKGKKKPKSKVVV